MQLSDFIPEKRSEYSLVINNFKQFPEFMNMVEDLFKYQPIDIEEINVSEYGENTVLLIDDGEVIAESDFEDLERSILLINSDLYKTGSRLGKVEVPDVIKELDEVTFNLRGYPLAHKEKLLLIVISRYIEQTAWEKSKGTIRSSFQELSRLDDERGTKRVYKELSDTDLDVHIYGVPDSLPEIKTEVKTHAGYNRDFQDMWFVIYIPEDERKEHTALLAYQVTNGTWTAFWTYDKDKIKKVNRYIQKNM